MDNSKFEEVARLLKAGASRRAAAKTAGVSKRQAYNVAVALRKRGELGEAIAARLFQGGLDEEALANVHSGWLKSEPRENGESESVYFYVGAPDGEYEERIEEALKDTIDAMREHAPRYDVEPALTDPDDHLLVIDPADVHIGKLSVASETGYDYDIETAVKRMVRGTGALMRRVSAHGVNSVVLVLGNDILHADRWNGSTTSGTQMQTSGAWHEWFCAARDAYVAMIESIAEKYSVRLVFTPSNHDWQSGYFLAQTVAAWFRNHENVWAPDYYMSLRHRKYMVYGEGLLGWTHGDGAPEYELPHLMQHEARKLWGQTHYAYFYTHHLHHKRRKRIGGQTSSSPLEKDHVGVTIIGDQIQFDSDNVEIEVVRSPSPPDGWHDRNGFVNRQAVECYLHAPSGAQVARFTEWF